jgi:hypothetical protein
MFVLMFNAKRAQQNSNILWREQNTFWWNNKMSALSYTNTMVTFIFIVSSLKTTLMKRTLNSDGQQFHQYQQNKQLTQ